MVTAPALALLGLWAERPRAQMVGLQRNLGTVKVAEGVL